MTNLALLGVASQTICEFCQGNPASFRYELFSTRGSITGNCCLTCLPKMLGATTDGATGGMGEVEPKGGILPTVSRKSGPAN